MQVQHIPLDALPKHLAPGERIERVLYRKGPFELLTIIFANGVMIDIIRDSKEQFLAYFAPPQGALQEDQPNATT